MSTPLIVASVFGHADVVEALLQARYLVITPRTPLARPWLGLGLRSGLGVGVGFGIGVRVSARSRVSIPNLRVAHPLTHTLTYTSPCCRWVRCCYLLWSDPNPDPNPNPNPNPNQAGALLLPSDEDGTALDNARRNKKGGVREVRLGVRLGVGVGGRVRVRVTVRARVWLTNARVHIHTHTLHT